MNIENVKALQIEARKAKDTVKANILTLVIGEYETLNKRGSGAGVVQIAKKLIKANEDSLSHKGDDETLKKENEVLDSLVPKQMSEKELRDVIEDAKLLNIGQIMKMLNSEYKGQFDGKLASKIAKEYIELSK